MNRTALVTGHLGFIGRHMITTLAERGYTVAGWDTRDKTVSIDCRDAFRRLRSAPDLVVHCAAMVDGREAIDGRAALIGAYNLQLDGALWEWALRARPGRIVYFSSSAAYPTRCQAWPAPAQPLAERIVCEPLAADQTYGLVKAVGERVAQEARSAGIPVTVVRPFSGYGADQDDRYPFPAMVARAVRRDAPFDVWGDGKQVRDFVHVDDVVGAVLALVDAEQDGPVNIGTGVGTSMDDLARLCMHAAGYEAPIRHLDSKPSGVAYRVADTRRLREVYEPKVTLEEGVRRAIEAARS
ncbi:MAG: NAD-dependent epimerase/dehydratase family protein [Acidiferrobacteraceae bacterium]